MNRKLREHVIIFLKGLFMGSADAVPGVSGGTIALITGIYERLVNAVASIPQETLNFFRGLYSKDKELMINSVKNTDPVFLTVLGTGVITALISVLSLMASALENFPVETYGFFTGLIALSAVILAREIKIDSKKKILTAITGFLFAFTLSGYATTSIGHSPFILAFSGLFAVSAMFLPGISGSLVLVMLGQYAFISERLSEFISSLASFISTGQVNQLFQDAVPILFFLTGAFTGLFTTVTLVKKAFENYRELTMIFLVSMIAGALRAPVSEVNQHLSSVEASWITVIPEFALFAFVGALIIFIIDLKTDSI